MLRQQIMTGVGLAVLFFLGGCSAYSPMEQARAEAAGAVLGNTLERYAEAIRNDNVEEVMNLVDPDLAGTAKTRIRRHVEVTTWLEQYSGYRVNLERSLAGLDAGDLNHSLLKVRVVGENLSGSRFVDGLLMRRRESKWYIRDMNLQAPQKGAALDMPREELEKLRAPLQALMQALGQGKVGTVMSILPDKHVAYKRQSRPGFLGRLFGGSSNEYDIYDDLERASRLNYPQWPQIDADIPLAYVGPATVIACYDVPYTWPEGGVYNDSLRVEILFTRSEGEWGPQFLRLYGKAIPPTR